MTDPAPPGDAIVWHLLDARWPVGEAALLARLACPPQSYRLIALGRGEHHDRPARLGLDIEAIPLRGRLEPLRSLPLGRRLSAALRARPGIGPHRQAVAVLHAHSLSAGLIAAAAVAYRPTLRRVPLIVDVHLPASPRQLRRLARVGRAVSLVLVARSTAVAQQLAGAALPDARVVQIEPAVPDRRAEPIARSDARRALGLDDQAGPVLLSAGRCERRDNQRLTLWAGAILNLLMPGLRVIVPGGGPLRDGLIGWLEATGFARIGLFPGDRFDWATLTAAADVLVGASDRATDPAPALHAMAAGRPIVWTHGAHVDELLGPAALRCPAQPRGLAMAVRQAVTDAAVADRLICAGRALADRFDPDAAETAYRDLYRAAASPALV